VPLRFIYAEMKHFGRGSFSNAEEKATERGMERERERERGRGNRDCIARHPNISVHCVTKYAGAIYVSEHQSIPTRCFGSSALGPVV